MKKTRLSRGSTGVLSFSFVLVCLIHFGLSGQGIFADELRQGLGIKSNIEEGIFPDERSLWFSVPDGQFLRLSVNGHEVYSGAGPANVELDCPVGQERFFDIRAERFLLTATAVGSATATATAAENLRWSVVIDRSPPPMPNVDFLPMREGGLRPVFAPIADSKIYFISTAACQEQGPCLPARPQELCEDMVFPANSFAFIAWAVDSAGNESELLIKEESSRRLQLINPVPGLWANRQTLAIAQKGFSEIRYTVDGSDPALPGALHYSKPVLIDRQGTVFLRVMAKTEEGHIERSELRFAVQEEEAEELGFLGELERGEGQVEEADIPLAYTRDWADALAIVNEGATWAPRYSPPTRRGPLALPALDGPFRRKALVLSRSSGRAMWRFILPLGSIPPLAEAPGRTGIRRELLSVDGAEADIELIQAESLRLLNWKNAPERALWRYVPTDTATYEGEQGWQRGRQVLALPMGPGRLEWMDGPSLTGKEKPRLQSLEFLGLQELGQGAFLHKERPLIANTPLQIDGNGQLFSIEIQSLGPGDHQSWEEVFLLPKGEILNIQAAEDEEIEVRVLGPGGIKLGSWLVDRRAPPEPVVQGPESGAWLEHAAEFSVLSEFPLVGSLYSSPDGGQRKEHSLDSWPVIFEGNNQSPINIHYTLRARDGAGNESAELSGSFTVDYSSIYVDPQAAPTAQSDGSRQRPYARLHQALENIQRLKKTRIALKGGTYTIDKDIDIPLLEEAACFWLDGGYDENWKKTARPSEIVLGGTSSLIIKNRAVKISDISLRSDILRQNSLLNIASSSRLTLLRTQFRSAGPLISGSNFNLEASFSMFTSGQQAIEAKDAKIFLNDCILGQYPGSLVLPEQNSIYLERSQLEGRRIRLSLNVGRFVRAMVFKDSQVSFSESGFTLFAEDLGRLIDAQGGSCQIVDSEISVHGRDVLMFTLKNVQATFSGSQLNCQASGLGRAFEIIGTFPTVENNRIAFNSGSKFSNSSNFSQIFAGLSPLPGSVMGNEFINWALLYDEVWADEDLGLFNARYSRAGRANSFRIDGQ